MEECHSSSIKVETICITNLLLFIPPLRSPFSRTLTQMATATFPGTSLKPSGTTSLTSASSASWTRTSERSCVDRSTPVRRQSRAHLSPRALFLFPRDGKISREEMIDYFMKASSLLNCKMGFIHTFTETTYVKPTFCEHCAGFVSQHLLIFSQFYLTSGTHKIVH